MVVYRTGLKFKEGTENELLPKDDGRYIVFYYFADEEDKKEEEN